MRLVTLPAIRLQRFAERLAGMGLTYDQRTEILQALEDTVEVGAKRLGSLCPQDGCKLIMIDERTEIRSGNSVFHNQKCPEHGYMHDGAYALVIAFEPCT